MVKRKNISEKIKDSYLEKVATHFQIPIENLTFITEIDLLYKFKNSKDNKIYCYDRRFEKFKCTRTIVDSLEHYLKDYLKLIINRSIFSILPIVLNIVSIIIGIIFLHYLGYTFDSPQKENSEWILKFIEVICWIIIIVNILFLLICVSFKLVHIFVIYPVILNFTTSMIGLLYIKNPKNDDWKKKYLIFLSWYTIVGSVLSILYIPIFLIDIPLGFFSFKFPIFLMPRQAL